MDSPPRAEASFRWIDGTECGLSTPVQYEDFSDAVPSAWGIRLRNAAYPEYSIR